MLVLWSAQRVRHEYVPKSEKFQACHELVQECAYASPKKNDRMKGARAAQRS